MRRFFAWFLWSALFGLVPYGIAAFVYWFNTGAILTWNQLIGSGQVLLTSAALLGSGLKELSQTHGVNAHYGRVFLTWSAAIFLLAVGVAYGMVAAPSAGGVVTVSADRVVVVSFIAYPASLLAAASAIVATRPANSGSTTSPVPQVGS